MDGCGKCLVLGLGGGKVSMDFGVLIYLFGGELVLVVG